MIREDERVAAPKKPSVSEIFSPKTVSMIALGSLHKVWKGDGLTHASLIASMRYIAPELNLPNLFAHNNRESARTHSFFSCVLACICAQVHARPRSQGSEER